MGSELDTISRICPLPPGSNKAPNRHLRRRTIFMAASLTFILTAGLAYYWMQPRLPPFQPLPPPHGAIAIDGDANFRDTALLYGWPGDGSPESPYIIDGLDIDLGFEWGPCIDIRNTRVNFIIRNCKLTSAGDSFGYYSGGGGISLGNVRHGELVDNIVDSNAPGIFLEDSTSNSLVNNTCNSDDIGIYLYCSNSNIITNNTLNGCGFVFTGTLVHCRQLEVTGNTVNTLPLVFLQDQVGKVVSSPAGQVILVGCSQATVKDQTLKNCSVGILLWHTNLTTLVNNTCANNKVGISLSNSHSNTVANNTCCSNGESGICLSFSNSNSLVSNTISTNRLAGIALDSSNNSTITGNTALYNGYNGIWVANGNNNTIAANLLNDNGQGITLVGHNNIIIGNTANNNNDDGIGITEGTNNIISSNTACNNNDYGLGLQGGSHNTITENTANKNHEGIFLTESVSNTISSNTVHNNVIGIVLHDSDSNILANNTCSNNLYGISLSNSHSSTVANNTCSNNRIGIYRDYSSSNTLVNDIADISEEFDPVVLLLIGLVGITAMAIVIHGAGWRKAYPASRLESEKRREVYEASRLEEKRRWEAYQQARLAEDRRRIACNDDVDVPLRHRLVSWLDKRRSIKRVDVDESLEADSSDQ
ncbi:MAG: nitrous oxide reductase family maturation protein NosD [Promethearchaeota archaeon]